MTEDTRRCEEDVLGMSETEMLRRVVSLMLVVYTPKGSAYFKFSSLDEAPGVRWYGTDVPGELCVRIYNKDVRDY